MFCVYLISYKGNKLPPFYIGSTSVKKIQDGYKGSVKSKAYAKMWKAEVAANPHLFKAMVVSLHKTRKEATVKEHTLQTKMGVVKSPLYVNMAVASKDGFFGMDVSGELNPNFGKKASVETKAKMLANRQLTDAGRQKRAEVLRKIIQKRMATPGVREELSRKMSGANNPQYGKTGEAHPHFGHKHTDDTKKRMSEALKGKKKTAEHVKHASTAYKVQRETDMSVFSGYGLTSFSKAIGRGASSFLYTLTSQKFMEGYRILENLGMATDDLNPLTDYM